MRDPKNATFKVKGAEIKALHDDDQDYISITDIARYKDAERTDYLILNWLRNRNTDEFLGIWERLNNPDLIPSNSMGLKSKPASTASSLPQSDGSKAQKTHLYPLIPVYTRFRVYFGRFSYRSWIPFLTHSLLGLVLPLLNSLDARKS